ncbi:hypothetical protein D3C80_1166500 [compost metagenome]
MLWRERSRPLAGSTGSGVWLFSIAATSWRWAGMMMRNTLPTMMVPMIAPTCRYAPRPLNTLLKP